MVTISEHLADDGLVVRVGLKGKMHVGINQARQNELAAAIHGLCLWNAARCSLALNNALDLAIRDGDIHAGERLAPVAINQCAVLENESQVTPLFSESWLDPEEGEAKHSFGRVALCRAAMGMLRPGIIHMVS